jgi:hypothetical protein
VVEHAGAAARDSISPTSSDALRVIDQIETITGHSPNDREQRADRIEAFSDRRVARYWTLVAIINGWPPIEGPDPDETLGAWAWYARALRAHRRSPNAPRA